VNPRDRVSYRLLLVAVLAGMAGCRPITVESAPAARGAVRATVSTQASQFPRSITDSRGKTLTLAARPQRIVSLMPSNTEILYAIGAGNRLVLDTSACDYPPQAKLVPHVNAMNPDIEPILARKPDLVIADDRYNDRLITGLESAGVPTLVVGIRTVDQTYDAVRMISNAVGAGGQGTKLAETMAGRIAKLRGATAKLAKKPTVLIMYGDNPIYTTGPGSFISELIGICGGTNVVAAPLPGDIISAEKVVELQPEVIIASPDVLKRAVRIPGWADAVPAIQNRRTYTMHDALIRPGPRLPEAAEQLARYLHPEITQ